MCGRRGAGLDWPEEKENFSNNFLLSKETHGENYQEFLESGVRETTEGISA